jgi:hypothetical protein
MAHLVVSAPQWSGWQQLRNNQHKIEEAKSLSPQQDVAAQRLNWGYQLCNGWGGSDDNNDNNDDNYNDEVETTTTITITMAMGIVGINTGVGTAAVLCQGLTMPGKRS